MTGEARRWCLRYALLLALVTTIPYGIGFAAEGGQWAFTGFLFGVEDGNSYVAKMLEGSDGAWLFRSPYTAEPQRGALVFLPYLLLGKLAAGAGLHLQLVALFHLARVAAIPLLVVALYRLAAVIIESERWRRWAVVMATAGGGLGWLLALIGRLDWLGSLPLDLYSPETFGFLAVFGLPHLIVGRAALAWGLAEYLRSDAEPNRAWRAGAAWLVMGLFQPLSVVTVLVILGVHLGLVGLWPRGAGRWQVLRAWGGRAFQASLVTLPIVLTSAFSLWSDPFIRAWTGQNRILSPHPLHYLIAFGLILAPALRGGWAVLRRDDRGPALIAAWALTLPLLAYWPHNLQRRLPEGVWVALVILAARGIADWSGARAGRRWPAPALLSLSMLSSLMLVAGGLSAASRPAGPVFRPAAEVAAFQALADLAPAESVVLASYATGNALPAWAPVRVLIGHGPESVGLAELMPEVNGFFGAADSDDERRAFLSEHQVDYVFWGPAERAIGEWDPGRAPFLAPRYAAGGYAIYAVDD